MVTKNDVESRLIKVNSLIKRIGEINNTYEGFRVFSSLEKDFANLSNFQDALIRLDLNHRNVDTRLGHIESRISDIESQLKQFNPKEAFFEWTAELESKIERQTNFQNLYLQDRQLKNIIEKLQSYEVQYDKLFQHYASQIKAPSKQKDILLAASTTLPLLIENHQATMKEAQSRYATLQKEAGELKDNLRLKQERLVEANNLLPLVKEKNPILGEKITTELNEISADYSSFFDTEAANNALPFQERLQQAIEKSAHDIKALESNIQGMKGFLEGMEQAEKQKAEQDLKNEAERQERIKAEEISNQETLSKNNLITKASTILEDLAKRQEILRERLPSFQFNEAEQHIVNQLLKPLPNLPEGNLETVKQAYEELQNSQQVYKANLSALKIITSQHEQAKELAQNLKGLAKHLNNLDSITITETLEKISQYSGDALPKEINSQLFELNDTSFAAVQKFGKDKQDSLWTKLNANIDLKILLKAQGMEANAVFEDRDKMNLAHQLMDRGFNSLIQPEILNNSFLQKTLALFDELNIPELAKEYINDPDKCAVINSQWEKNCNAPLEKQLTLPQFKELVSAFSSAKPDTAQALRHLQEAEPGMCHPWLLIAAQQSTAFVEILNNKANLKEKLRIIYTLLPKNNRQNLLQDHLEDRMKGNQVLIENSLNSLNRPFEAIKKELELLAKGQNQYTPSELTKIDSLLQKVKTFSETYQAPTPASKQSLQNVYKQSAEILLDPKEKDLETKKRNILEAGNREFKHRNNFLRLAADFLQIITLSFAVVMPVRTQLLGKSAFFSSAKTNREKTLSHILDSDDAPEPASESNAKNEEAAENQEADNDQERKNSL